MSEPSSTPAATKATAQSRDGAGGPVTNWPDHQASCAGRNIYFTVGAGVARAATISTYERLPADPVYRPLQVYPQDPSVPTFEGAIAVLRVPYEPLKPGPIGAIFQVENGEEDHETVSPLDLEDPKILIGQGLHPTPANPQFHGQMVYAVCSSVYATFRAALGRRIAWGFDRRGHDGMTRLKLRPRVRTEGANAAYDRSAGEIRFGYFPSPSASPRGRNIPGAPVYTCMSHDVIVHELTHALIDGMRSHFLVPTGSEVLGFHEGLADIVAMLQHFTYTEVLRTELRKVRNNVEQSSILLGLARSLGLAVGKEGGLRTAADARRMQSGLEAHEMGTVLASAVFDAFRSIYKRKTDRYLRLLTSSPSAMPEVLPSEVVDMLADEASKLAGQFLSMCVRALDYCPPLDIRLGEFLRAMITADRDLVPDDPWAYRETLIDAFAGRGIYPSNVSHLSEDALCWKPLPCEVQPIPDLSFAELKFAGDPASPANSEELTRQACALGEVVTRPANLGLFGLVASWDERLFGGRVTLPCVQSMRTTRRVGPDGQVVFDLVAEVTQSRFVRDTVTGDACEFIGGSTIILGPKGEFRYVVLKNILSAERLEAQLAFQRGTPCWTRQEGQFVPLSNVFALTHERQRATRSLNPVVATSQDRSQE